METSISKGPAQRLMFLAVLIGAVGVFALMTLKMPWYTFSFSNDVMPSASTGEMVQGVEATMVLDGFTLGTLEMESKTMKEIIPVGPANIIMPMIWLGVAVIAGLAVAFLRNSLFSFVGLISVLLGYKSMGTLRNAMENPQFGGTYNTPEQGIALFTLTLMFAFALLIVLGAQCILVKRREKAERRAAGEDIPPSIMDTITSVKFSSLANVAGAVVKEVSATKEEAKNKVDADKAKT